MHKDTHTNTGSISKLLSSEDLAAAGEIFCGHNQLQYPHHRHCAAHVSVSFCVHLYVLVKSHKGILIVEQRAAENEHCCHLKMRHQYFD